MRSSRPTALSYGASMRRIGPRTFLPVRESKIAVAVPAARQQQGSAGVDVRFPNHSNLTTGNLQHFA